MGAGARPAAVTWYEPPCSAYLSARPGPWPGWTPGSGCGWPARSGGRPPGGSRAMKHAAQQLAETELAVHRNPGSMDVLGPAATVGLW